MSIYDTQTLLPKPKHPSMAADSTSLHPSFLKPLILPFSTRLRLPDEFVRKHRVSMCENMKLGIGTGKTWDVKVEETDIDCGGEWYFTVGWKEFVEDLELKEMQMLVFWLNIGEATFDVSVYATNTCQREISELMRNRRLLINDDDCVNESADSGDERRPRFEFVLTDRKKGRIHLHKNFAEAAGLVGKGSVVLQFPPEERCWSALLVSEERKSSYCVLYLGVGWNDFRIGNRMVMGRKYSLEFDPLKNVILVKDMNK